MALDPDLQAKVIAVSGASPDQADDPAFDVAMAQAFGAVGVESPAAQLAPVAIVAIGDSGRVQSWNRAAETIFGWAHDEVVDRPPPFTFRAPAEDPLAQLAADVDGASIRGIACTVDRRDGSSVHVLLSAARVDPAEGAAGVVAFAVDVTNERESEIALEEANHRWRNLLKNISDTVTILDRQGRLIETTGKITDVLGYPSDAWKNPVGFKLVHPDEQSTAAGMWVELMRNPGVERREVFRTRHAKGHYELIEYTATNLFDDPAVGGMVMRTRSVTREKRAERLLADEARVLELVARDAPLDETLGAITALVEANAEGETAVMLLDPHSRRLRVGSPGSISPEYLAIWTSTEWPLDASRFGSDEPLVATTFADNPITRTFAEEAAGHGYVGGHSTTIISNQSRDVLGSVSTHHREPRHPTDQELKVAAVAADLAAIAIERDRWHRELTHQARHHPVTDLPNRAAIRDHLDAVLERRDETGGALAVMFVDIDRFKVVNDSLGHAAGDLLLVRFAGRLSNLVRPGDFVGHFGADGFIVVLDGVTDRDDLRFVAHRLEVALGEPFALEENEVYVSASIGVAIVDEPDSHETSEDLIQHADAAMFRAKEQGRGRMEIFDHAMRRRASERLRIDRDLRAAIERDEFEVHYQPEVDLRTGTVVGVEALLRWNHPDLGLLLPDDFLEVAEDTGVIVAIGAWVLEQALAWAAESIEALGSESFNLAVNLSARQLNTPGITTLVGSLLEQHAWPAGQLVVELDESALADDREAILDVLTQLRELGITIAIDDFGTGFSSLSYLHRFPVDIVKIDPSFVTSLHADGSGSPVVTAIVNMAHALGIVAAAEGVEEPHQLEALRELGCDRAQGFLFSEAVPAAGLDTLLAEGRRW